MTVNADLAPDTTTAEEPDDAAAATLHALLLRLAGSLPDRALNRMRDLLAAGYRLDTAQAVAFEAMSQPVQLDGEEIAALRLELAAGGADVDLVLALEELRGERPPAPWQFLSTLPSTEDDLALAVRPTDRTVEAADPLDPVDRALVAGASAVAGVRAVWRAWRMPPGAQPWREPVRVAVISVDDPGPSLPDLTVHMRRILADAGDPDAQVEVVWTGFHVPHYQTMARSCGALLWAHRPARAITTARVFDGVDPVRGPWFATNRPVVAGAYRDRLLEVLRSGPVIAWSSAAMIDVLTPERGAVVPLHLRTDGVWVWSDAAAYFLEQYGLQPDPELMAHLDRAPRTEPLDEISIHRALVHLYRGAAEEIVWEVPGAADDPVPAPVRPDDPWPALAYPDDPWPVAVPDDHPRRAVRR